MKFPSMFRTRWAALGHDLAMIPVAWLGAFWLRFNLDTVPEKFLYTALAWLPLLMAVQGLIFWQVGLYRGVWRFASIPDLVRIVKGVAVGTLVLAVLLFLATRLENIPRSTLPLYVVFLVVLLGAPRLIYRWAKDHKVYAGTGQRVLVVGAGRGGEALVRDMRRDDGAVYLPLAFVDDDPLKQRREIHGVRVAGKTEDIPSLVDALAIDIILIAMPSVSSEVMQRVVELCESTSRPFRTLPGMADLVSGWVSLREIREVQIEDLLGREQVALDWHAVGRQVQGQVVIVTGGGGSIGAELCRQIAAVGPARLVIFEQSEFNLFIIERELKHSHPALKLFCRLGDVMDAMAVRRLMEEYQPSVLYHAAAYKHVPMLQHQVREAVRNNVLGTRVMASAAAEFGVKTFVLISTDKAVNPTNVMGATKRIAELVCQWLADAGETRYITVRFGNVLDSTGSVVPTFRDQIRAGGPVTVTHRDIERYFMTIPEACQLIMEAGAVGQGGEIFILDMGEPVKIQYLAEQMIRLSGRTPGKDIEIVYTGLRPGEKLYEELFYTEERIAPTAHDKLLLARVRPLDRKRFSRDFKALERACFDGDEGRVLDGVRALVPELSLEQAQPAKVVSLQQARVGLSDGAG